MHLKQLKLSTIRNLQPVTLEFSEQFNWIFGKNGSGKTSLLETLSLLCTGRSFRTRYAQEFIQEQQVSCVAAGIAFNKQTANSIRLGFERHKTEGLRLRLNEQPFDTLSEWVKMLPLQVINVDSFQLLNGASSVRRQFLDWAMFHVEPSYYSHLQRYRRVLKQRNAALKHTLKHMSLRHQQVEIWNSELITSGDAVTTSRDLFLSVFFPIVMRYLNQFLPVLGKRETQNFEEERETQNSGKEGVWTKLRLIFHRGWEEEQSLSAALAKSLGRDTAMGYTTVGAHRADFSFLLDNTPIETRLSRGQMKLFISALYLARAEFVAQTTGRPPISLVDDVSSELDNEATLRLLGALSTLKGQIFATSIEPVAPAALVFSEAPGSRMFHVEHGFITPKTL